MMESFQALIAWLTEHPSWLAWAIFGISFVESLAIAGIIVPGVAMLFAAAALAGRVQMALPEALIWAALGAIAGDGVSFALGRQFKGRLHRLWPLSRYPSLVANGEHFFRRHGGKSVVIGRFIGPIRPILPLIAGALEMPARRFFAYNILSAIGWAPIYIIPGFLVGSALALNITPPPHFYAVLTLCLATLCLVYLLIFGIHGSLRQNSCLYQRFALISQRHPVTRHIWQQLSSPRDDDREFPLASLMLAIISAVFFSLWAWLNLETNWLGGLNQVTADFIAALRDPLLKPLFVVITLMGNATMLTLLIGLAVVVLAVRRFYAAALHLLLAGLAVTLLTTLIKTGFAVPRPGDFTETYGSFAFPSGHASGTTVLMGLAASFIAQESRHQKRWPIYLLCSVPIVMVAISRLYLGVHWMTDIIGGVLLGLAVCGVARVSFSHFNRRPIPLDRWMIVAGLAGAALTIGYVYLSLPAALKLYGA